MNVETYTLPGGLRVVLQPQRNAPVVALAVWVGVGSADEAPGEWGLAHVHEHMLFKGTARRGVGEIARAVEAAGGEINAWTSPDYTVYHAQISSRFFDTALDVLADAVQHPSFDVEELGRELEVIDEEFKRAEDTPGYLSQRLLFSTAYTQHPYGRPVMGDVETVRGLARDDVLAFFQRWYRPSNMTLVVVGDVDPGEAREQIEARFDGGLSAEVVTRPPRVVEPEQRALRWASGVHDVREHHLQIGFRVPGLGPDSLETITALSLLATALGGSESSRLHARLCRERALVNAVGVSVYAPSDIGLLIVSATFQASGVEAFIEVLEALLLETFEVCHRLLGGDELERARILLMSQSIYEKQTVEGQAQKLGFYHGILDDPSLESRYYALLESLDAQAVRRVTRALLTPERASIALVTADADAAAVPLGDIASLAARCHARHAQTRAPATRDEIRLTTLPGGLRVIVQQATEVPLLSVRAAVPGGKRHESAEKAGVSDLISGLLTRGTMERDANAFAASVERLAGGIGGFSGSNALGLVGTFLSRGAEEGLRLFSEALWRPRFDEAEFERERELILEDFHALDDDLAGEAFRLMTRALYGEHPYGRMAMGTEESVRGLEIDDLHRFYRDRVRADQMVVAVVGDVDPDEVTEQIARLFDAPPEAPPAPMDVPALAPPERTILSSKHIAREQGHLVVSFLGVPIGHPDRPALDLLSSLLSGQGGRLFLELRDRQSLAYSVTATHRPELDPGYFACYIATSPDKLQRGLDGILGELQRLRDVPVDATELERAQQYIIGSFDISLQRASTRAGLMALHALYGLPHDHHLTHSQRLMAIGPDRLLEVARRYLDPERAIIAAVHPEECALVLP